MTIQPLGRGSLALSLSCADLTGLPGVSPDTLDNLQLLALLRRAGITLPPRSRVEVYARSDALLLLIQPPRRPRHYGYIF